MFQSHIKYKAMRLAHLGKAYHCFIAFVLLAHLPCQSFCQTSEVDSLENLLSQHRGDSERLSTLNELSLVLMDVNPKKALFYAEKALALAQSSQELEKEITALLNIGMLFYDSTDKRDSALIYFINGEKLAEENNFKQLQADYLMRLANWYRYHEVDSTKTVDYLQKSIEVSQATNYNYGTARSYAKLASFYTRYKQVQLCEEYLESSEEYYLKLKNGKEEIAHYYDEVGNKIWDYNPLKGCSRHKRTFLINLNKIAFNQFRTR